jgi:hypothetical protein
LAEQVLIVGLAAWRFAYFLMHEDGPGSLMARLRHGLGVPISGEVRGLLPTLLTCPWCLTVWTAVLMWGLWHVHWVIPGFIAAAGVAAAAERWVGDG